MVSQIHNSTAQVSYFSLFSTGYIHKFCKNCRTLCTVQISSGIHLSHSFSKINYFISSNSQLSAGCRKFCQLCRRLRYGVSAVYSGRCQIYNTLSYFLKLRLCSIYSLFYICKIIFKIYREFSRSYTPGRKGNTCKLNRLSYCVNALSCFLPTFPNIL